jgi:hypothetical protein
MRTKQILPLFALLLLVSGTLIAAECEDAKIFLQQVTDTGTKDVTLYAYVNSKLSLGEAQGISDAKLDFIDSNGQVICSSEAPAEKTGDSGTYYEYSCKFDYSKIKQKCGEYSVRLTGPLKYCPAESTMTICDESSSTFTFITNSLNESLKKVREQNYGLCLIGFIMMGVLLATMFYSGKSPMSLLNVTTPNLPSPKSLAAGGQVMGHMVYGRMKKMYVDALAKTGKIMDLHSKDLERSIGGKNAATLAAINAMFSNMRGDPHTRTVLKFIALSMAANGESIDSIRAIVRGKSLFAYSKDEHEKIGKAVQDLKRKATSRNNMAGVAAAGMIDKYILTYIALNKMRMLTGESGENRGVTDTLYWIARVPVNGLQAIQNAPYIGGRKWVKKVFETQPMKIIGGIGLGHFPIIGGFVGTSIDALFRSIRITGRYGQVVGGSIVRGVARKTGALDSAKIRSMGEALDKERVGEQKMSYMQRMAYRTLTAGSPETTKTGGMYPIFMKAKMLYEDTYKECHYDAMCYLIKQLYGKYGVKFDKLTEKKVASFMHFDADVLDLTGLRNNPNAKQIHELELQIRKILGQKPNLTIEDGEIKSLYDRVEALRKLAKASGLYVDPQMGEFLDSVQRIHATSEDPHVKFIHLRGYLIEKHHIDNPNHVPYDLNNPNKFYTLVGRDNLRDDRFTHIALRSMIFSAENNSLHGGLGDALSQLWLYVVNRARSLAPTDAPGATPEMKAETRKITERIRTTMLDLMTEEGKKAATKFGKGPDDWSSILTGEAQMKNLLGAKGKEIYVEFGDRGSAGILRTTLEKWATKSPGLASALESIDKGLDLTIRKAFPAFFMKGASIAYYKKGGTPVFWDDENILGPSNNWWKVDMKRDWQNKGSEQTIEYYVNGIFEKGYKMPYKASVYRQLLGNDGLLHNPNNLADKCNPNQITKDFANRVLKKAFASDALFTEMDNFLNGAMAMNVYKHFNETSRFYLKMMQGMLIGSIATKHREDMEKQKNPSVAKRIAADLDSAISGIESLDPTKPTDALKLARLLQEHKETVNNFMKRPFTYDLLEKSPHAWVFTHEGGFAPFVHGMSLSDFDRAIGGFVALKDSTGKWRRYDPQNVDIKFDDSAEGHALKMEFARLQSERDPQNWAHLLESAGSWAKGNYERQKQYNAVLWRYAQHTDDWHGFWDRSDITVRPKHEVLGVRSSFLPYPSANDMSFGVMEPLRKLREWGRDVGTWMERSSLYAAGNVYSASYEIVPTSKFLALQLADYARDIRLSNPEQLGVSKETFKEMNSLADDITSKILMTQEFGIDRHPGRHSTSHGLQNALAASFHYGPAATFDTRWYKAYFTKTEYVPYTLATWPAQIARYMALPAITAFRGFQMSLFGYPNKWNYQESALQPFPYRFADLLGAFRSIANPFYSSLNWFSGFGLAGDMIERDTGGPKFRRGNRPTPAEMDWIGKGTQYWARVGFANPGETRLNPRMVPEIASPMAEYLAHRDQFAGYYSQIPEIQKQAYRTFVKREAAAAALMIRREEELRGYAPMANPIWGWTSPFMFAWHLPGLPISPRDIYMHYKEGKRRMGWEQMSFGEKTKQVFTGGGGGMLDAAMAQLKPWYTDETGETKLYGAGGRFFMGTKRSLISCPTCGGVTQRWGACPKCSKRAGGIR